MSSTAPFRWTPNEWHVSGGPIPPGVPCWACGQPIGRGHGVRVQGPASLVWRIVHRGRCQERTPGGRP